jgi:hypothetical protein
MPIVPLIGGLLGVIAILVIAVTISGSATKQGKHDELAGGTQVRKGRLTVGMSRPTAVARRPVRPDRAGACRHLLRAGGPCGPLGELGYRGFWDGYFAARSRHWGRCRRAGDRGVLTTSPTTGWPSRCRWCGRPPPPATDLRVRTEAAAAALRRSGLTDDSPAVAAAAERWRRRPAARRWDGRPLFAATWRCPGPSDRWTAVACHHPAA